MYLAYYINTARKRNMALSRQNSRFYFSRWRLCWHPLKIVFLRTISTYELIMVSESVADLWICPCCDKRFPARVEFILQLKHSGSIFVSLRHGSSLHTVSRRDLLYLKPEVEIILSLTAAPSPQRAVSWEGFDVNGDEERFRLSLQDDS